MKKLLTLLAFAIYCNINAQTISTVAGTGTASYTGDNGQATAATLNTPARVAIDNAGNLIITDRGNNCIRKLVLSTGVITTIAGTGVAGFSGDNGLATAAKLNSPADAIIDANGNIYISDTQNQRIRKITASSGIITTIAGIGTAGYNGDGIAATTAQLNNPYDMILDAQGNLYIADRTNNRVRKIITSTNFISTISGNGSATYTGDNGLAASATVNNPIGLAIDASGNIFVGDYGNSAVRKIDVSTTNITTVAGNGTAGFSGDNGAATSAQLSISSTISVDAIGNLFISDVNNNRIREVVASTGIISTIAGTGVGGYNGDGIAPTAAKLNTPAGTVFDANNSMYIADQGNNRIRKITTPCPLAFSGTTNLCSGKSTVLTASGATSYTWSANAASASTATVTVNPTTNTTYTVTGASNTCISTNTITVNVTASPTLSISGDTTLCLGDNTTLIANGSTTYTWTSSTFNVVVQSINTSPANDVTYTVTTANGNCIDVKTVTIHVTPLPNPIISGLTNVCSNGNGTILTASGPYTFTWSANAGSVNTNSVSVNPTSNTTYSLVSSDGTCFGNDTVSVTVTTTPTLSINGNTNICSGTSTTLSASGATSYTWSSGTSSIVTQTVNASPNNTTTYTVTAANGNCTDMGTVTVSVTPIPIIDVNGTANICSGANGTLLTAIGATTYTWSTNAASANTNTVSVNPTNNTTYTVTGSNGMCSTSDTVHVIVIATPTISANSPISACSAVATVLTATGATTYTWSANANNATTNTVTINVTAPTTYTVVGANGNCESSAVVTVTVLPSPIITSVSDTICTGQATLHASGASTYTWSPTPDFSNGSGSSVIYSPTLTTTYTITGTATTSCVGTTTVAVVINCNTNGIAGFSNISAQISIYPNPAQNNFTVEVSGNEKQNISLFDITGKQVLSQTINGTTNIDASNLAAGVYNISISGNNGATNKRLVIVK